MKQKRNQHFFFTFRTPFKGSVHEYWKGNIFYLIVGFGFINLLMSIGSQFELFTWAEMCSSWNILNKCLKRLTGALLYTAKDLKGSFANRVNLFKMTHRLYKLTSLQVYKFTSFLRQIIKGNHVYNISLTIFPYRSVCKSISNIFTSIDRPV